MDVNLYTPGDVFEYIRVRYWSDLDNVRNVMARQYRMTSGMLEIIHQQIAGVLMDQIETAQPWPPKRSFVLAPRGTCGGDLDFTRDPNELTQKW